MLQLYWYCLARRKADETFVRENMMGLEEFLKGRPVKGQLLAAPLDEAYAEEVEEWSLDPEWPSSILDRLSRVVPRHQRCDRLLIYCESESPLAKQCKEISPGAVWGYYERRRNPHNPREFLDGGVSAVYCPRNEYILWHEALHLFNVDDCHDGPALRYTCGVSNCLMRYDPSAQTMTPYPTLCQDRVAELRKYSRRHNTKLGTRAKER